MQYARNNSTNASDSHWVSKLRNARHNIKKICENLSQSRQKTKVYECAYKVKFPQATVHFQPLSQAKSTRIPHLVALLQNTRHPQLQGNATTPTSIQKHSRGSDIASCCSTSAPPPTPQHPHHRPRYCAMKLRVSRILRVKTARKPHKFEELKAVVHFQSLSQTEGTRIPDLVLPLQNMRHFIEDIHDKLKTPAKQRQRRINETKHALTRFSHLRLQLLARPCPNAWAPTSEIWLSNCKRLVTASSRIQ